MIRTAHKTRWLAFAWLIALAVSACSGSSDPTKAQPSNATLAPATTQTQETKPPPTTTRSTGPLAPNPGAAEDDLLYNLAYPALDSMQWFARTGFVDGDAAYAPQPLAQVGDEQSFELSSGQSISASLVYSNEEVTFWVEDGVDFVIGDIQRAADRFANQTIPRVTDVFGDLPDPGVDGDPRLAVLHAFDLGGAAGEFVSRDLLPASEFEGSNEREMIYLALNSLLIGSDNYYATLAHELQHLLDFQIRQNTPLWMAEGMAQVAERVAGFDQVIADDDYLSNTAVPLNDWNVSQLDDRHYGGSYLFLTYIYEQYGAESMTDLMESKLTGMSAVDALARSRGGDLDQLVGDWLAAIALDDASIGDGNFVFESDDLGRACPVIRPDKAPFKNSASVPQFAPRYYEVAGVGPIEITFTGNDLIGVIPDLPYRGEYLWWAGRADNSASSMTRSFDLSGVSGATLEYRIWFDTGFDDGGTVQISTDGGVTWDLVEGRRSDQIGLATSYSIPAYTGTSGNSAEPTWIRDEINLADYTGEPEVLVKFEFATDLFEGRIGFAVDNIELEELGYFDGAEEESDWQLDGFARTNNRLPQPWTIRVIQPGAPNPVTTVAVEGGTASLTIDGDLGPATVAVVATAPGVGTKADYTLGFQGDLTITEEIEGEREEFSRPCHGWEIEETDSYTLAVQDDAMTITVRQNEVFAWTSRMDFHEDVTISAAVRFENDQEALAGLMCRLSSEGFYDFEISSDGFFYAGVQSSTGFETVQEWTTSPVVLTGPGVVNELVLACLGDEITFTVNGTVLVTLTDDRVRAGQVALSAGSFTDLSEDAVAIFDNVVVDGADLASLDNVVLHETFETNRGDWTEFNTARAAVSIEDEGYVFEVRGSDWSVDGYYEESFDDVIIDAQVRVNELPPDTYIGLACRTDENFQQYLFLVSADGSFSIFAGLLDEFVEVVPWSPLYALDTQAGALNQFHVECVGDRLRFEVNGVVAADVTDSLLSEGQIGFLGVTYERGGLAFDVLDVVLRRP